MKKAFSPSNNPKCRPSCKTSKQGVKHEAKSISRKISDFPKYQESWILKCVHSILSPLAPLWIHCCTLPPTTLYYCLLWNMTKFCPTFLEFPSIWFLELVWVITHISTLPVSLSVFSKSVVYLPLSFCHLWRQSSQASLVFVCVWVGVCVCVYWTVSLLWELTPIGMKSTDFYKLF